MSKKNILRVYGCGGAGVNLVAGLFAKNMEKGCALIEPALIDTSTSNLRDRQVPEGSTYLVPGLDGSGKVRAENHVQIQRSIKQVLVDIEPKDVNLVVFSAAGGSGSVIGPLLLAELNERKIPALAIVIGSDESIIASENTLKTLQSLELIAQRTNLPVVMSYHQNEQGRRKDADDSVRSMISCMAILTSGENLELDSRDIAHWLQFTKVSSTQPRLSSMHIAVNRDEFDRITAPISVASLYHSVDQEQLVTHSDYHTVGFADMSGLSFREMHFCIGIDNLADIGGKIKASVHKKQQSRDARVVPGNLLSDGADGSMEGSLIL